MYRSRCEVGSHQVVEEKMYDDLGDWSNIEFVAQ